MNVNAKCNFIIMKNRLLLFCTLISFSFAGSMAQGWEAEMEYLGAKAPGGFSYQWKNYNNEQLGNRTFQMNYLGARELKHAPEAGVHPRIYFNPEDTAEIRQRLYNTRNGIEVRRKRHTFTTLLYLGYSTTTTGGTFNRNASYARSALSGKEYINNTGYREVMIKRPFNPMEKVYRTIALCRGKHPFVIIADDVKKNNAVNNFKWVMQLPSDVSAEAIIDLGNGMYDILLKEIPGDRRLLVRVLVQQDYASGTPPARIENHSFTAGDGKTYSLYRLVCESNSVEPDFKVMLFPLTAGEQLPETTWDASKQQLAVLWPDQSSNIGFSIVDGMTRIAELRTSAPLNATSEKNLRIYPNPATNQVRIENTYNAEIAVTTYPEIWFSNRNLKIRIPC